MLCSRGVLIIVLYNAVKYRRTNNKITDWRHLIYGGATHQQTSSFVLVKCDSPINSVATVVQITMLGVNQILNLEPDTIAGT